MYTFLKSQLTSIIATAVDFVVTIAIVELLGFWQTSASATGNVCGAITSFFLNRKWAFEADKKEARTQAAKYLLVWCGYLCLNTLLMAGITTFTSINYIIGKIVVALVLGIGYNYGLYKKYVFK